jgi:hypothetical protein
LFALDGRINNFYQKKQTQYYEGSFNILTQLKHNEIAGGNFRYHTIRLYEISPLFSSPVAAQHPGIVNYPDSLKVFVDNQVGTNYFGYNFLGTDKDDIGYLKVQSMALNIL